MAGASGLGLGPAALRKSRRPSVSTTRAAMAGENPSGWVVAAAMGEPNSFSTAEAMAGGRLRHGNRSPLADGNGTLMGRRLRGTDRAEWAPHHHVPSDGVEPPTAWPLRRPARARTQTTELPTPRPRRRSADRA